MSNDGDFRKSYEEAMLEHKTKLTEYNSELNRFNDGLRDWNMLSYEERRILNENKEDEHRFGWSILLVIMLAIGLAIFLKQKYHGHMFFYIWGGSSLVLAIIVMFLYRVFGLFARGAFYGALMSAISYYVLPSVLEKHGFTLQTIKYTVIVIGVIGFIIGVIRRPSAKPRKPRRPITPNRNYYK